MNREDLRRRLEKFWETLPPQARLLSSWQPSRRFSELTYVREELLGSFKARKYATLLPWLRTRGYRRILLKGSSHSSNVLGLALLLQQAGFEPHYVLEGREGPQVGNGLLSRLALGECFHSERPDLDFDWEIPEGASAPAALAGSLGLVGSLMENALSREEAEPDVYIDSGTGFTAAALLLGLGYFRLPWRVVVVSMTGQERAEFDDLLCSLGEEFGRLTGESICPPDWELTYPPVGRSFGSTSAAVFEEIRDVAQAEGILCDPLYAAKLSLTYRERRDARRPSLLIVSGGERELLGFQRPLRDWLAG